MSVIYKKSFMTIGNENINGVDNLSDIDLTAATLDSRIKYKCASNHAYYAADGTIQFAEPNVWPLEYQNGVAVGRHEPEPQATNYNADVLSLRSLSQIVGDEMSYMGLPLFMCTYPPGRDKYIQCRTAVRGRGVFTLSHYALYDPSSMNGETAVGRAICFGISYPGLDRQFSVSLKNGDAAQLTGSFERVTSQRFRDCYRCIGVIQTTDAMTSLAQRMMIAQSGAVIDVATTQMLGTPQVEDGKFATSPIVTDGSPGTRAAAFASVKNPGGSATSIRVHYSDSTTADFNFPADGSDIPLPQSDADWGTRYITRIQYARSL